MNKCKNYISTKLVSYANLFLLLFAGLFFSQCSSNSTQNTEKQLIDANNILFQDSCNIDSVEQHGIWNYKATTSEDLGTRKYFSRTNKESEYGITYKANFNKNTFNKNIKVVIQAYVRSSNLDNSSGFSVSVLKKDSTLYWFMLNLKNKITKINEWTFFSDTLNLPQSLVSNNYSFSFFLWNNGANGTVDADDVRIKFIEIINPSFTPDIQLAGVENNKATQIYKNSYYSLFYNPTNGSIFLSNKNGDGLLKNISYLLNYKLNQKDKKEINFLSNKFQLRSKSDSTFNFLINDKLVSFDLILTVTSSAEIKFFTQTHYNSNICIVRESIIANYEKEVKEVYTKNRKVNTNFIQDEYWLDKEGFKIGSNSNAITLYHLSKLSSIQLNTKKKQFILNLDYNNDHLRMTFPILKDSIMTGVKYDVSCTEYTSGDKSENSFSIYCGIEPLTLPRFMKNPYGFLAAYIFTEHADFSDYRAQCAVNFGSEEITHFKNAIGGFAKYKIPVTKSVFYHNPDKVNNNLFNKKFTSEICNIKSMPNFALMLQEMHKNGYEICLHTPDEYTSKLQYLNEALNYFKTHFNSKTWIDHGYDNPLKNNKEDFVCDGFNKSSNYYSQPLFKKYQVNFFWNCYNEDSALYKNYNFDCNIKLPYIGFGDFIPLPDYCKHLINGQVVYSWQATSMLFPKDGSLWNYFFNDQRLQNLINNFEVGINHCYPARVDSLTGFYDSDKNGKLIINAEFNKLLEKLAYHRENGNINTTTIKDFINYNLSIENIEYEVINKQSVKLKNNTNFEIKALSLIIKASKVNVLGKKVVQKKDGENLIFWFDFNPKEDVIITF